jgi:hypothetical protein
MHETADVNSHNHCNYDGNFERGGASIRPYVLPSISRNKIPSSVRIDLQVARSISPAGVSDFLAALPVTPGNKNTARTLAHVPLRNY